MMHWIDPDCLPETQGAVEGFIMNRHGEIDGVLLAGTRQTPLLVCTPPHMAAEMEAAVEIGETIRVRGVRPRRADIIAAVALTASNGETIIDNGPGDEDENEARHRGGKPSRMDAEGVVRLSLFGPRGAVRCSKTAPSFASVRRKRRRLPNCCAPARSSPSAATVYKPSMVV
jgi:hypothetical protein